MRRLLTAALAATIIAAAALPAAAQQPVQLGGTGASNTGADDKVLIGNGSGQFVERSLVNCTGADAALQYDAAGNTIGCGTISGGHTIQLNGTTLASQPILNFAGSASVLGCVSSGGKITCTITAAPTNYCVGSACNLNAGTQIAGNNVCLANGTNCPSGMNFETGWSAKTCNNLSGCEQKDTAARYSSVTVGQCNPSTGTCYYEASSNWVGIDETDIPENVCRFGPTDQGRLEVVCENGVRKLFAWTDELPGSAACPAGQAKVGNACQPVSRIKIDGVEYPIVDLQASEDIRFDPYGTTATGATQAYLVPQSVDPSTLNAGTDTPEVAECVKVDSSNNGKFAFQSCLSGLSVGDCTTGACFAGTTGNSLQFEGSSADDYETTLTAANTTSSDKTITLPNETGTVCTTGSVCSGYQASITDLSSIETATNHGVPVGNGSAFATKALPDADAPSTLTAGATLHYDQGTQAFSASTVPTVSYWASMGWFIGTSNTTETLSADTCECYLQSVTQPIGPIDNMSMRWSIGNSNANAESIDVGVYTFDGNTKVFDCDIKDSGDSTATNGTWSNCKSGTPTDNTEILQPGDYWVCIAAEATASPLTAVLASPLAGSTARTCRFTQTCTGSGGEAVLPSTLTNEECTWQTSRRPPGFIFNAE